MDKSTRKIISLMLIIIIIASLILIYKINQKPKYDKELYLEVYSDYKEIFREETNETNNTNQKEKIIQITNASGQEYSVVGKISIPKIHISYPVIYTTSEEYLKVAPTKLSGPEIGEVGNVSIVGHNYNNQEFFSEIYKLILGDYIYIYDIDKKQYNYAVYDRYEVNENDVSCLNQQTNGNREITLITCTNDDEKRLVVKARQKL